MSDPNYMHEFNGNREGFCKRIVSGAHCHQTEDAQVHRRWEEAQKMMREQPPEKIHCEVEGCDCKSDELVLHSACHTNVPMWPYWNQDAKVLRMVCAECGKEVCKFDVNDPRTHRQ